MFYNSYKSKLNCNKMSCFRGVFMVIMEEFVWYSSSFKKKFWKHQALSNYECYLLKQPNVVDFVKRKITNSDTMAVHIWRAKRNKTKEVFYKKLNTKRLREDPRQRLLNTVFNDLQTIIDKAIRVKYAGDRKRQRGVCQAALVLTGP